jgi:diguanylate cyclase (GGDEF)-like protein/PAS domain S-box-containing protein
MFGYDNPDDIIGNSISKVVHPDDRKIVEEYNRKRHQGEPVRSRYEFKGIGKDGAVIFVESSVALTVYHGKPVSLAYFRDITERRRMEEQLHTMSIVDELTGLYNRRGFFTLSQQQLKIAERTKKDMVLFFSDLDHMKLINDTLGHQEGDKALIEVAAVLRQTFRVTDIIGRMGGDEFAILAIDATGKTIETLMKRLHSSLDSYNKLENRQYKLILSVGIAHCDPENPASLDELIAQADALMYEEKRKKQR